MSVQAGIWNFDGAPVERDILARMSVQTAEYGQDGEVIHVSGNVGMLYRPFHTTAESRLEHQPYRFGTGKVMTWDGRVDNREELISQLGGMLKDSQTDVAIVSAAFEQWGTSCFARLIGDWATAIWNANEKELILARDYIGMRHLFYHPSSRHVIWCNHLDPLVLPGSNFTLCEEYIAGYLTTYPEAHLTPYQEVHSVPPGKWVSIRGGRINMHTYWGLNSHFTIRHKKDAEYEEQYRCLFSQAVRRRLRTDSPVLAELSGGWDSSCIVCMADHILAEDRLEQPKVDTFSYYDSNEPLEDDLPHLLQVEEKRGRRGIHVDLKGCGDSLQLDHPTFLTIPGFGHRAEVDSALTDIRRRGEYRVMFCGTGGDEMNGQSLDPRIQMADLLLHLRVVELVKQLTAWSLLIRKRPWIQLLAQTVLEILPASTRARLTERGRLEPWVNRDFAKRHRLSVRQLGAVQSSWFSRPSVRDAHETLITLSRRMTYAASSVPEKRCPYLDQTLVEFLTAIPLDQLLRPGQRRSLMRRALKDTLPPLILSRSTKASAARCYPLTLEKHWDTIESIFHCPVSARLGYTDRNQIHAALLAMKNGQCPTYVLRLVKALFLEVWLRKAESSGVLRSSTLGAVSTMHRRDEGA